MATFRICKVCGDLHDIHAWPDNHREWIIDNRSELPAPMYIRDGMEPVKGMHDGRIYDSKSAMRASYRAHGVVEVGNDSSVLAPAPKAKKRPDRKEIRHTLNKAISQTNLTRRKRDELPTR